MHCCARAHQEATQQHLLDWAIGASCVVQGCRDDLRAILLGGDIWKIQWHARIDIYDAVKLLLTVHGHCGHLQEGKWPTWWGERKM